MSTLNISMMFPSDTPNWRINDTMHAIKRHLLGIHYTMDWSKGDTDDVCVDCFPMGIEAELYDIAQQ